MKMRVKLVITKNHFQTSCFKIESTMMCEYFGWWWRWRWRWWRLYLMWLIEILAENLLVNSGAPSTQPRWLDPLHWIY